MSESQVSGCQLATWLWVNAQTNPLRGQAVRNVRILVDVFIVVELTNSWRTVWPNTSPTASSKKCADGQHLIAGPRRPSPASAENRPGGRPGSRLLGSAAPDREHSAVAGYRVVGPLSVECDLAVAGDAFSPV